jgi:hypothetical protein
VHRRFPTSQAAEQQAKIQEIKRQESQKQAERETIKATINKLGETIPLLQEKEQARRWPAFNRASNGPDLVPAIIQKVGAVWPPRPG